MGRYNLLSVIGRGGMGKVYVASVDGDPDRLVAIKAIHHGNDDATTRAIVRDEARISAAIAHPNVVSAIDVIDSDDGLFLVMPYVHGVALSEVLAAGARNHTALEPAVASAIVCQALDALEAAHGACAADGTSLGIVHRDVSPQNIMIGRDGAVYLLDFGVAKARGRLQRTTKEGILKGKLAYMSPEQVHGVEPTPAIDIYAAGVVLWECLTSARLFAGENEVDTFRRVLEGHVPPLCPRVPGIEPHVDAFFAHALARAPHLRFPSAVAMRSALERAIPPATREALAGCVSALAGGALADLEATIVTERASLTLRMAADHSKAPPPASYSSISRSAHHPPTSEAVALPSHREVPASNRAILLVTVSLCALAALLLLSVKSPAVRPIGETQTASAIPSVSHAASPPGELHVDSGSPSAPVASVSASAPPSVSSKLPRRPPVWRPAPAVSPSTSGAASRPSSEPPALPSDACATKWYIDSEGHKKFKAECF